jgi:hypothetical protein
MPRMLTRRPALVSEMGEPRRVGFSSGADGERRIGLAAAWSASSAASDATERLRRMGLGTVMDETTGKAGATIGGAIATALPTRRKPPPSLATFFIGRSWPSLDTLFFGRSWREE